MERLPPVFMKDVLSRPDADLYLEADEREFSDLERLGIGVPCELPHGKKAVKSKVVRKIKYLEITPEFPDKRIDKYKSRLVACGYSQIPGVDFFETFSPVVQLVAIRLLMILCITFNLFFFQLDVGNAFINATLKEEIYVEYPDGF